MNTKPLSVLHTIAEHYHFDASDFLERFCILREVELSKTGRIKNFVELLMACECALKSHAILGQINKDACTVYSAIRAAGHNIEKLADAASYMSNRQDYEFLKENLKNLSVFIRYSLEAYDTFFPALKEHQEASVNYAQTLGSAVWINSIIEALRRILNASNEEFTGWVTDDIMAILNHEAEVEAFMRAPRK